MPKELTKQSETQVGLETFLAQRDLFIQKVKPLLQKGVDYYELEIGGRVAKPSLGKPGAEKIASILGWTALFEKDPDVTEAFSSVPGLIAFRCNLTNHKGIVVGQGRGASTLAKNNGDPNKTIKMAQKSSFIDAVIRGSGLSDIFTQDLEDMTIAEPTPEPTPVSRPTGGITTEQLKEAVEIVKDKDIPDAQVRTYIKLAYHKNSSTELTEAEGEQLLTYLREFGPKLEEKLDKFGAS